MGSTSWSCTIDHSKASEESNRVFIKILLTSISPIKISDVCWSLAAITGGYWNFEKLLNHLINLMYTIGCVEQDAFKHINFLSRPQYSSSDTGATAFLPPYLKICVLVSLKIIAV